jgi:hypothetical protein
MVVCNRMAGYIAALLVVLPGSGIDMILDVEGFAAVAGEWTLCVAAFWHDHAPDQHGKKQQHGDDLTPHDISVNSHPQN